MKRPILYVLFAGALVLNSCKKHELPKNEDLSSPVFYFKCDMNGVPLNVQAGEDGYHMNASYYRDKNDLYVYKGELRQNTCSGDCGFSMAILINDYKFLDPNSSTNIDNGLHPGSYSFIDGGSDPLNYTASFEPSNIVPATTYSWLFSDGATWTTASCSRTLDANKAYSATLTANDFNTGCTSSHTNVFKVGSPLHVNISSVEYPTGSGQYTFTRNADVGGELPYTYRWDFNDGSNTDTNPEAIHTFAPQKDYRVSLTLVDKNKDSCISYYQVNRLTECNANFNASFKPVRNTKALSAITILMTDSKGVVYSSNELKQSTNSKFEIISVEDYQKNELGEPTKKVKVRFSCSLNSSNGPLTINNGEAVIAVSYK